MQSRKLLGDPVRLFRLAKATDQALAERNVDLRTEEARLHAAIAYANYTRDCHLAMIEASKDSSMARRFAEPARRKRVRAERYLRLCLAPLIAAKYELMKHEDLLNIAGFALSMIP